MSGHLFTRRSLLAGIAVALASGPASATDAVMQLDWPDLLPPGAPPAPPPPRVVNHDSTTLIRQQPPSTGVRKELNGKLVRIAGYIVPLEFEGSGLKTFLLAPYVGACIHVPPPPANQLILISTDPSYESDDFYGAVAVTGPLDIASISSDLADIGYAMNATRVEPYAVH